MPKRQPLGRIKPKKKVPKNEPAEEPSATEKVPVDPEKDIVSTEQVIPPPPSCAVEPPAYSSQVKRVNDKQLKVLPDWYKDGLNEIAD